MARAVQNNTLAETLEMIQTQLSELRQSESLEFKLHEMVLVKRHRLDALMADFVELATAALTVVGETIPPHAVLPADLPEFQVEEMTLAPLTAMDAPKDLFQAAPTPSAQHVLDSVHRLMCGMKGLSAKPAAA